jgi:hypothetical protein
VTEPHAPLGLRSGLERLSRGLIAYGIIGLVVAAIGLGALVWVSGRVGSVSGEVQTSVRQLATTVDRTATTLHDASTTARTFTATIDQSALAVSSTAATITEVRADLAALEAQLRSVNLLGATPLSSSADAVGRITASLEGLDTRLSTIAADLAVNRGALASNSTSLGQLGDSTAAIATRLGSGAIENSLGDVQAVIAVTLLLFAAWSLVPAVGALVLGVWLRRELERRGSGGPQALPPGAQVPPASPDRTAD